MTISAVIMNTCLVLTLLVASVAITAAGSRRQIIDVCTPLDHVKCQAECDGDGYCDRSTGLCLCKHCKPQPGACFVQCGGIHGHGYCDEMTHKCVCDTKIPCNPDAIGRCYMACNKLRPNYGSCHRDTLTCWCTVSGDPDERR